MTDGRFLCEGQWRAARCEHSSTVQSIVATDDDASLPCFVSAPVDLHVHGAGGHDVMDGEAGLRHVLRTQAERGCGAMLATSVAAPDEALDDFLASVQAVMASPDPGSATLLGAHLEGPFINPDKLGAQPAFARGVDLSVLQRWLQSGAVRVITYAPEMDPDNGVPALCAQHQVRAQLGHSLCDCWQARAALAAGCGVTHLWNAMSGASHRDGGLAVAALGAASYAEIIADGIHVEELAFKAALRAIPNLYTVTDGTAAVGMPDGRYRLGSHQVTRRGNRVELDDGTLAGSCLDQIRLCTVLREWDMDWPTIVRLNSTTPAAWVGAQDLGRIGSGSRAHWLELNDERIAALWLDGQRHEIRA